MNLAFREKLKYFETWLRNEVDHALRGRYELGQQALELYKDERDNGGKAYGRHAIDRICTLLRWDDGVIRTALRFVQTFTPEDLERLCGLVLPKGEPVTWSHVRTLVQVRDAARRQQLLDKTVAEGWTCDQLAHEMRRLAERPANDGRGRPPRLPRHFDDAVAQQQESADRWDRLHTKVWVTDKHSLAAQAAQLAPEEVTDERLRGARQLAAQLRRVADEARAQAEQAEEVVRGFERILAERQRAEAPARPASRRKTA
jgi:hypothetical protein